MRFSVKRGLLFAVVVAFIVLAALWIAQVPPGAISVSTVAGISLVAGVAGSIKRAKAPGRDDSESEFLLAHQYLADIPAFNRDGPLESEIGEPIGRA